MLLDITFPTLGVNTAKVDPTGTGSATAGVPFTPQLPSASGAQTLVAYWGDGHSDTWNASASTPAHIFTQADTMGVTVVSFDGHGTCIGMATDNVIVGAPPDGASGRMYMDWHRCRHAGRRRLG